SDPCASEVLVKACRDFGFFYLVNHGVTEELMKAVFDQSKAFFSLPLEDKRLVLADKNNRGFTPMYEEILDPANQSVGDTKEGYYIRREVEAGSEEATRPLEGPNRWPPEELLPG
ncbi:unnamed protein product, partial [Discosporangium mesarthrocarpum]